MTAFRSQTDAMLAAKYDTDPWAGEFADGTSVRWDSHVIAINGEALTLTFDPRPEFIPPTPQTYRQGSRGDSPIRHMPRSEPNPILVNLRADVMSGAALADAVWAYQAEDEDLFDNSWSEDFTVEQRDHARRVLARLAHFTTTNR